MNRFLACLALALGAFGCGAPVAQPFASKGDVPVAIPADAGYAAYDAGTRGGESPPAAVSCAPGALASFEPHFYGNVGPYAGACSDAQLDTMVAACFAASATKPACDSWVDDTANAGCLACWAGPTDGMGGATVTSWAPVLYTTNGGQAVVINEGGCIALADPSALMCAQNTEYAFECDFAACESACPIPAMGDDTAMMTATNDLFDCFTVAESGGCASYAAQASTCESSLMNGPAGFCYTAAMVPDDLLKYLRLACGARPQDAGLPVPPEDGGPYDGGMPDSFGPSP